MRRLMFIVSAIAIALIVAPVAHASSVYDNVIVGGGNFTVSDTYTSGTSACNSAVPLSSSVADNWSSLLLDPTLYPTGATAGTLFWNNVRSSDTGAWSVTQNTALSDGTSWGYADLAAGDHWIHIVASMQRGAEFATVGSTNVLRTSSTDSREYDIGYSSWFGTCKLIVGFDNTPGQKWIANEPQGASGFQKNIFVNFDITYPSGYAGIKPPDSYTPPSNIQFVWAVDENGVVTATYTQNLPPESVDVLQHCGITWELNNSDSSWVPGTNIDTTTQEFTLTYRYDHITPGFYQLTSKPNFCTPYIDDGSITPITVNIPFNGSFVGGTSSAGGNTAGPFATQSTFLNQFGLTQAVQAPLNAIKRLVGTSCSSISLPIWTGSTIVLPCMSTYYSNLSVMYGIWQVTITGVVAYWFGIKAFHHIRGLVNPNNDRIATVDL